MQTKKTLQAKTRQTEAFQKFESREKAGSMLAVRAMKYTGNHNGIVLAFPGAIQVGAQVAAHLALPLDMMLISKITVPRYNGLVLGTITTGNVHSLNFALIDRMLIDDAEIRSAMLEESLELAMRARFFRGTQRPVKVADQTVILVDDGGTPCATVLDSIRLLRRQHAERIVVAVPTICHADADNLRQEVDELVTLSKTGISIPVAKCYRQSRQTSDADVRRLLTGDGMIACA